MDMNQYTGPSEEWMKRMDEIEATCLSVAVAGLAAELGMVDRELVRKSREAMARDSAPAPVE
jgi:hypothetical protein